MYLKDLTFNNFTMIFDFKMTTAGYVFANDSQLTVMGGWGTTQFNSFQENVWYTVKIVCNNGTGTSYRLKNNNFVQEKTWTYDLSNFTLGFGAYESGTYYGRSITWKNLKIRMD